MRLYLRVRYYAMHRRYGFTRRGAWDRAKVYAQAHKITGRSYLDIRP